MQACQATLGHTAKAEKAKVSDYKDAIQAFGRKAQWQQALASFADMRRHKLQQNSRLHTAAINVCKRAAAWQAAVALLADAGEMDLRMDIDSQLP